MSGRVPVDRLPRVDELGELTRTFHTMALRLQTQQAELVTTSPFSATATAAAAGGATEECTMATAFSTACNQELFPATTLEQAQAIVDKVGYPVLMRPSYVLGGRAMEIVYDDESLKRALDQLAGWLMAARGFELSRQVAATKTLRRELTAEQEAAVVSDPKLLLCAICALSQWTLEQITAHYRFTDAEGIDGLVLRYGFFYGPGTHSASDGSMIADIRRRLAASEPAKEALKREIERHFTRSPLPLAGRG